MYNHGKWDNWALQVNTYKEQQRRMEYTKTDNWSLNAQLINRVHHITATLTDREQK